MFTPIIGLEIHLQLKTRSKVFCRCSTNEAEPNTNICPICLAYPGAMPDLNKEAVIQSIRMGLALNCKIANQTSWDRKSYMYPDLFKGYQISQLDAPICGNGAIEIIVRDRKNYYSGEKYSKKIGIIRAHLEEDTAKSIHEGDFTLLDGNKAGIPLLEIVSEPEMYSVDEAVSYAKSVQNLAKWFDVSECNLELGQMRFDANISILVDDIEITGKKFSEWKGAKHTPIVEIKNLNSFGNLQSALEYEINRQIEEYKTSSTLYTAGSKETRGWDEQRSRTYVQRHKEEANEYRFTPEPDIPVLEIRDEEIKAIKDEIGIHQESVFEDLMKEGVSEQSADLMASNKNFYNVFTLIKSKIQNNIEVKKIVNLITNELASEISELKPEILEDWINGLAKLFETLGNGKISEIQFRNIVKSHKSNQNDWVNLLEANSASESIDIKSILQRALEANPGVVEQIKKGKESAKMFFVGIVMKESKGQANPEEVKKIIDELLS